MPQFEAFPADPRERTRRAIEAVAAGQMVILVDDESRENEGDLVMAADKVTPEAINFMVTHARGLICLPLTSERVAGLGLEMMVHDNASVFGTAFTVSIEAHQGVTTGISAADRAQTIATAVADGATAQDIVSPGHIFPLRARDGGVLVRAGQTEGSVDLARLAGCVPAGVICEIMNDDGTMSRLPQLLDFAQSHQLQILTVADLIAWRLSEEPQVDRILTTRLHASILGEVTGHYFRNRINDVQYLALIKGDVDPEGALVRVHGSDVWGDALQVFRRDGGPLLHRAMEVIAEEGAGVILYVLRPFDPDTVLRQLTAHSDGIEAEVPPERPVEDPYPTGQRDYGLGAQVLHSLGVRKIRLITNTTRRLVSVAGYDLDIVERVRVPPGIPEDSP